MSPSVSYFHSDCRFPAPKLYHHLVLSSTRTVETADYLGLCGASSNCSSSDEACAPSFVVLRRSFVKIPFSHLDLSSRNGHSLIILFSKSRTNMELLSQLYEPDIGTNTNTSEETATSTATTNNGPVPLNNGDAATSNDTADESTGSNIKGIS
ncbi:unnamed protein product [Rhizophagus irregularis]|nr:unnamed protein product [Rhizophagus irregularis]